jgi:hypothetical protein
MVIGDLITYHQEVMFGVKFFDEQDPFTKPKSQDDGKTISFKTSKGTDKTDSWNNNATLAICETKEQTFARKYILLCYARLMVKAILPFHHTICGLRAPPLT